MTQPETFGDPSGGEVDRRRVASDARVDTPHEAELFIEQLRQKRDLEATQDTRAAVETLVANNTPWDGLWAFELVQNALDAGATRIRVSRSERGLRFEHNGTEQLTAKHVEGICGLGRSTKGLTTVGFMGVGFKSVFHRFRSVAVSAGPWRFRFKVRVVSGYEGAQIPEWFDAIRPFWDGAIEAPNAGFTTRFDVEEAVTDGEPWMDDLAHLANPEDLTPLAVLGLRRFTEATSERPALTLEIEDDTWQVWSDAGKREVRIEHGEHGVCGRWLVLRQQYRPNTQALRRFVEVRRSRDPNVASDPRVVEREVVGLVPLDAQGIPRRRDRGHAYATLPTAETVPFAIDLQADWFVDLARRGIREIEGNAWQEQIVAQIPGLVRAYLDWTRELPRDRLAVALEILACPSDDQSRIAMALARDVRVDALRDALVDLDFVPVVAGGSATSSTGTNARALARAFDEFASEPELRADILFGHPIADASAIGERARAFLKWLGWCGVIGPADVDWPLGLEAWWVSRPTDEKRIEDTFRLWAALSHASGWEQLPSVRTEAGTWVCPETIRRFNEAPPAADQPGGEHVARALGDSLPRPNETLFEKMRARVNQRTKGFEWITRNEDVVTLSEAIREAFERLARESVLDHEAFFALPTWALSRGARHDLFPLVLAETGVVLPKKKVLLACEGVPAADARRAIFPGVPSLDAGYLKATPNVPALIAFLESSGLRGKLELVERRENVGDPEIACQRIGVAGGITEANRRGYDIVDADFADGIDLEASPSLLCSWLELEWRALVGRGQQRAVWTYRNEYFVIGSVLASWVERLESTAWVRCDDGTYRRPTDVLPTRSPDYDDTPIAAISSEMIAALEAAGVGWGRDVSKAPALRRLRQSGRRFTPDDLASILDDALLWIDSNPDDEALLAMSLAGIDLDGRPLNRWVRTLGPAGSARSRLDDWVGVLPSSLAERLGRVPGYVVEETTTSTMALAFLRHVWGEVANGTELRRERREFLRFAYRYIIEDATTSKELRAVVAENPEGAFFFAGRDGWVRASQHPVVDDVSDDRIASSIASGRPKIRPTHFVTEDATQLGPIVELLGLERISELAAERLQVVGHAAEPAWGHRLRKVLTLLARGASEPSLGLTVVWVDSITLRSGEDVIELGARIDEATGTLSVVLDKSRWMTDVVPLLVTRYRLSQNGAACSMLAISIASVEDPRSFLESARRLARELDVDEAGLSDVQSTSGNTSAEPVTSTNDQASSTQPQQPTGTTPSGNDESSPPPQASTPPPQAPTNAGAASGVEFDGQQYGSVDAAVAAQLAKLDALGLGNAKAAAAGQPPPDRVARQPSANASQANGGGGFSPKSQVVGRLGERYAHRWLRDAPGRPRGVTIIDVSTPELRAAAVYPAAYAPPDTTISPGCDVLVFEEGDEALPVGYEIKSRRGNGLIEFEWSRREEEACRRVKDGSSDPHWPLGGYRVLVVSDLLVSGRDPEVTVLEIADCLGGAEATGWVVRARTLP